ncbi:MAG: hypothetical protein A2381_20430 [Bdellovibrionales bacterium RIFOXYB1_FULL_37_110]|nr:MAG: hypothetical protein A2181_04065 [Bdellovibrionales bacterium RIFOXYA1_FULL_38_20]OFZ51102.1 MAG: hypothetical protein A2417_20215 [Bdellovibrionales bacterium RIFOXYC1_FULL_37_79]OFZ60314.1 MAG: hypothetical protein A2381_20430 [Bdellovibrionales bacterium RIFOXYB1_FULL_37_110]OFZ63309.1 MAG: hypothetical protein A2577_01745 [Bdellovibrionales bacterium RIFOXYD1_FULL_36_51]
MLINFKKLIFLAIFLLFSTFVLGINTATRDFEPIANSAEFKKWYDENQTKGVGKDIADEAKALAEKMTWGEADEIYSRSGVGFIEAVRGCIHKCVGCMFRCDLKHGFQKMTWETFEGTLKKLVGLESALSNIENKKIHLLNADLLGLYRSSDPMNNLLTDKNGKKIPNDIMMKKTFEITKRPVFIFTAGWPPDNKILQESAERLIADFVKGGEDAKYIDHIKFEIKPHTAAFTNHLEKMMIQFLQENAEFMNTHGDDFNKHKLDFQKYTNPESAWEFYDSLASQNFDRIMDSSKYMKDRVQNLKDLLPVINDEKRDARLVLYGSKQNELGKTAENFKRLIAPFMQPGRLATYLNDTHLGGKLNMKKVVTTDTWNFNVLDDERVVKFPNSVFAGNLSVSVHPNGTISIDSSMKDRNFMTLSDNPHIKSLVSKELMITSNRKLWQIARDRLDTTQEPFLSEGEIDSIKQQLIENKIIDKNFKVEIFDKRVTYHDFSGKKNVPLAQVVINGKGPFWFEFDEGLLFDNNLRKVDSIKAKISKKRILLESEFQAIEDDLLENNTIARGSDLQLSRKEVRYGDFNGKTNQPYIEFTMDGHGPFIYWPEDRSLMDQEKNVIKSLSDLHITEKELSLQEVEAIKKELLEKKLISKTDKVTFSPYSFYKTVNGKKNVPVVAVNINIPDESYHSIWREKRKWFAPGHDYLEESVFGEYNELISSRNVPRLGPCLFQILENVDKPRP